MRKLGIGLIGSGFMGRAHALAFRTVGGVFDLAAVPELEMLADIDAEAAARSAASLGFNRSTGDWKALVKDAAVDIVAITTPNALHKPMSLAAIDAGKHVYCEKPLATTAEDARAMAEAAEAAGVVTMVGFNYLKNPMIGLAREIVASGEIGEITGFRGIHAEDFMGDPAIPYSWRCDPAQAGGALADIGSHIISMARFLVGDIEAVCGRLDTVIAERPAGAGSTGMRPVTVDDQANFLVRFANGAGGTISASWLATGRKMQLAFELTGTTGRPGIHAGAVQRAEALHDRPAQGTGGFQDHHRRPGPSALRRVLPGARPPVGLQRPEGHRGEDPDRRDHRQRQTLPRFPRGLRGRTRRRCGAAVVG